MDDATLQRLSRRTEAHPEFWARVFARYDALGGANAGRLAAHLGLARRDLLRLGLYLRPRDGRFELDLRQAADDFGVDRALLAEVVRFVDAVSAMPKLGARGDVAGRPGFLVAARARPPAAKAPPRPKRRKGGRGGKGDEPERGST